MESNRCKTGRQITLWVITFTFAVLFGNNIFQMTDNLVANPTISPMFYLLSLFGFRVTLGYIFD